MSLLLCGFVVVLAGLIGAAFAAQWQVRQERSATATPDAWQAGRQKMQRPESQNWQ